MIILFPVPSLRFFKDLYRRGHLRDISEQKIVAQTASKLLVGTGRKGRVDKNKRKLLIFSTEAHVY